MIASLLRWLFAGRVANTEILKCEDRSVGTNPVRLKSRAAIGFTHRQLCVKRLSVTSRMPYSQLYSQLKS